LRTVYCRIILLLALAIWTTACSPKPGSIEVRSEPSGALVVLDGKDVGKTPLTITEVAPGVRNVRVVLSGYKSYESSVEVARDGVSVLDVVLEKDVRNPVLIESNPSGARVMLGRQELGVTPLTIEKPQEISVISVVKDGHRWGQHVYLPEHSRRHIAFELEPASWLPANLTEPAVSDIVPPSLIPGRPVWTIGPVGAPSPSAFLSPSEDMLFVLYTEAVSEAGDSWLSVLASYDLNAAESRVVAASRGLVLNEAERSQSTVPLLPAGWLDEQTLLLFSAGAEPGREYYDLGLRVEKLDVRDGTRNYVGWFPLYLEMKQLGDWWLSPDKSSLYYITYFVTGDVYRMDLSTGLITHLKSGLPLSRYGYPLVHVNPEGNKVLYGEWVFDHAVYLADLDEGTTRQISPPNAPFEHASWSPDGKYIALRVGEPGEQYELLPAHDGEFLLASAIWLFDSQGTQVARLGAGGRKIVAYQWAHDSSSLYVVCGHSEPRPDMQAGYDWDIVGEGVHRLRTNGSLSLVLPSKLQQMYQLRAFAGGWLGATDWDTGETFALGPRGTVTWVQGDLLASYGSTVFAISRDHDLLAVSADGKQRVLVERVHTWGWPEYMGRHVVFIGQQRSGTPEAGFWISVIQDVLER